MHVDLEILPAGIYFNRSKALSVLKDTWLRSLWLELLVAYLLSILSISNYILSVNYVSYESDISQSFVRQGGLLKCKQEFLRWNLRKALSPFPSFLLCGVRT